MSNTKWQSIKRKQLWCLLYLTFVTTKTSIKRINYVPINSISCMICKVYDYKQVSNICKCVLIPLHCSHDVTDIMLIKSIKRFAIPDYAYHTVLNRQNDYWWQCYSISQEICTRYCCALLCCGYAIVHNEFTWSIYSYSSGLLCWHWGNR